MKKEDFWKYIEEDEVHTITWHLGGAKVYTHTGLVWQYDPHWVALSVECNRDTMSPSLLSYNEILEVW